MLLKSGNNAVKLEAIGFSGPDVDYLAVMPVGTLGHGELATVCGHLGRLSALSVSVIAARFCTAVLYGRAGRSVAQNDGFRPAAGRRGRHGPYDGLANACRERRDRGHAGSSHRLISVTSVTT